MSAPVTWFPPFAALDTALFAAANRAFPWAWCDRLMLAASSSPAFVVPVAAGVLYALARPGRRRLAVFVLLGAAAIGPLDFSANMVKKATQRTRPCAVVPNTRIVSHCPESPGFPSNHAANAFALAALATAWRRRLGLVAFPYAAIIAFSRVHLGVHYPFDVAGGALLGTAYGAVVGLGLRSAASAWSARLAHAGSPSPSS